MNTFAQRNRRYDDLTCGTYAIKKVILPASMSLSDMEKINLFCLQLSMVDQNTSINCGEYVSEMETIVEIYYHDSTLWLTPDAELRLFKDLRGVPSDADEHIYTDAVPFDVEYLRLEIRSCYDIFNDDCVQARTPADLFYWKGSSYEFQAK